MSQVPSAGMPNLGQKGSSTYGCHIKFYIIIGSRRAGQRMKREEFLVHLLQIGKPLTILLTWMFAPDFRNNSQRVPLTKLSHGTGVKADSACTRMSGPCPAGWGDVSLQRWGIEKFWKERLLQICHKAFIKYLAGKHYWMMYVIRQCKEKAVQAFSCQLLKPILPLYKHAYTHSDIISSLLLALW